MFSVFIGSRRNTEATHKGDVNTIDSITQRVLNVVQGRSLQRQLLVTISNILMQTRVLIVEVSSSVPWKHAKLLQTKFTREK